MKYFFIVFLLALAISACSKSKAELSDYERLLKAVDAMGWDEGTARIDTFEDGNIAVHFYRFSSKAMSDYHLFSSTGDFMVYYYLPGDDHSFELMIRRKNATENWKIHDLTNYRGLLLLVPDSSKSIEEVQVMSAIPIIGEYGIRLSEQYSLEQTFSNGSLDPVSLKDLFDMLNLSEETKEVEIEWFWRGFERTVWIEGVPKSEILETRSRSRIFFDDKGWHSERVGNATVKNVFLN